MTGYNREVIQMGQKRCRVCMALLREGEGVRCQGCVDAKAATDQGMTYGKYKAGCPGREPGRMDSRFRFCAECGMPFLPKRSDAIYCGAKCRGRHNMREYRRRDRPDQ